MSDSQRTPRRPLFPLWALLFCGFLAAIVVLVGLWMALGSGNWSATLAASAVSVTLLVFFSVGEFIRGRFRLSLRVLLTAMTLLAVLLGLFGNRTYHARNQRRAVQSILRAGGEVRHDIDESFGGGWFRTRGGLIFPEWLLEVLGPDMFGDVNDVLFQNGVIPSDDDLDGIDFSNFARIGFYSCHLSDQAFVQIGTLSHVRELYLYETGILDDNLASISRLENLENLRLALNPCISDEGIRHLSQMKNLRILELSDTSITGKVLVELAALERIEHLWLARMPITDEELKPICRMRTLKSINLSGTAITDEGVELLFELPNLEWVALGNTQATQPAIEKLTHTLDRRRIQED